MKFISALLVLFVVAAFVLWRKRRRAGEVATSSAKPVDLLATTSKFHAVGIRPGPEACDAALGLQGQRFLSDAAPSVPLPSCDVSVCRCRFVHFEDRRSGEDRRSPYPATIGPDTGIHRQEQRQPGDRRREPPNSW